MSDVKISALPLVSTPLNGTEIVPLVQSGTTKQATLNNIDSFLSTVYVQLASQGRFTPGGRLTVDSGDPIPFRDFAAQSTLYYTPFRHNNILLFNGTQWNRSTFSEASLTLSGLTGGKNYDVFGQSLGIAPFITLSLSSAWVADNSRTDALGTQDGTPVSGLDSTKLWLGTIRASSATTTEDTGGGTTTQVGGQRFVYNAYNQVPRFMEVFDSTASWSYATNTIRQANGNTGNKVEYITGDTFTMVDATIAAAVQLASNSTRAAKIGIGLNSTSAFATGNNALVQEMFSTFSAANFPLGSRYVGNPGLGYNFLSWNEKGSDGTCVFLGNNGGDSMQSGMVATIFI